MIMEPSEVTPSGATFSRPTATACGGSTRCDALEGAKFTRPPSLPPEWCCNECPAAGRSLLVVVSGTHRDDDDDDNGDDRGCGRVYVVIDSSVMTSPTLARCHRCLPVQRSFSIIRVIASALGVPSLYSLAGRRHARLSAGCRP